MNIEGRCCDGQPFNRSTYITLAVRVAAGRLARFWGSCRPSCKKMMIKHTRKRRTFAQRPFPISASPPFSGKWLAACMQQRLSHYREPRRVLSIPPLLSSKGPAGIFVRSLHSGRKNLPFTLSKKLPRSCPPPYTQGQKISVSARPAGGLAARRRKGYNGAEQRPGWNEREERGARNRSAPGRDEAVCLRRP